MGTSRSNRVMTREEVCKYVERKTGKMKSTSWLVTHARAGNLTPRKVANGGVNTKNGLPQGGWHYEWTQKDADDACALAKKPKKEPRVGHHIEYLPTPEEIKAMCEEFRRIAPRDPVGFKESECLPRQIEWLGNIHGY